MCVKLHNTTASKFGDSSGAGENMKALQDVPDQHGSPSVNNCTFGAHARGPDGDNNKHSYLIQVRVEISLLF